MGRSACYSARFVRLSALVALGSMLAATTVRAEVVTLKNGMQLQGSYTKIQSLNQNPLLEFKGGGNVDVEKIVLIDDDLRRTFVSSNNVRTGGLAADTDISLAKIRIPKRVAQGARRVAAVGPIVEISPFDEFGNRIFSMLGHDGRVDVVQGITEITPLYTKVEGLLVKNAYEWDMRINTSSIPRDVLTKVLLRAVDQTNPDARLQVVKLYIQSQRYYDALAELDQICKDFPALKELEGERKSLKQLVATDMIREIELRRDAGQYLFAYELLSRFPSDDVAGELLLKVRNLLDEYESTLARGQNALQQLQGQVDTLSDHRQKEQIVAITQEIAAELNVNNIDRLADFIRLVTDEKMKADQKVSLAITGWLLGSGSGSENLAEALSLVQVRGAVREYLVSENQIQREDILQRLEAMEGSTPGNLAKLIATMKPPVESPIPTEGVWGLMELSIPGVGDEPEFRYYVQVPPEYDPSRRYPCIVTLHGAGSTPLSQIDWWAGPHVPGQQLRVGQATRHGYFVIAPAWAPETQNRYQFSLREHAAVLGALRDACRQFSIDTDRVFLSGHSMGGDAAWDIGLAHPDLWAGVLPVVATADKYISRYWKNAKGLPMYFVGGQLDSNKIADNAMDWDRYLERAGFDAMYVEYKGRGHEHFSDEILRMFDWMGRYRREFVRKEFVVTAMRPWDQFFWWVELDDYPDRFVVMPTNWPQPRAKDAETDAQITQGNTIRVKTPATSITVWLSPELVDFSQRISFERERIEVTPSSPVLLEDVRTRGDRQHPFWAKYTTRSGRR